MSAEQKNAIGAFVICLLCTNTRLRLFITIIVIVAVIEC